MNGRADLRLGISDVAPVVSCGTFSARAVVGEHLPITATVFREGHDAVAANVVWTAPGADDASAPFVRMAKLPPEPDRWIATVVPDREGPWTFRVEAWSDPMATWRHAVEVKIEAGQGPEELANDLEEGARLFDRIAAGAGPDWRDRVVAAAAALRDDSQELTVRVAPALASKLQQYLHEHPVRELVTRTEPFEVFVDRPRALYGAWYEFFPRSEGAVVGGVATHGTFTTAARPAAGDRRHGLRRRLPAADPPDRHGQPQGPEHRPVPRWQPARDRGRRRRLPVGDRQRRGRPRRGAPAAGHPRRLRRPSSPRPRSWAWRSPSTSPCRLRPTTPGCRSTRSGSTTKPDGTIAYAENPPKKYQDIYPVDFDNDPEGIYAEVLRVVRHWMDAGVRIFRVDNPHTKPLNFWQLADRGDQEDRPRRALPGRGVHPAGDDAHAGADRLPQSYTYFTWRTERDELDGVRPRARRRTRTTCGPTSS